MRARFHSGNTLSCVVRAARKSPSFALLEHYIASVTLTKRVSHGINCALRQNYIV